jgi:hypothetical protein
MLRRAATALSCRPGAAAPGGSGLGRGTLLALLVGLASFAAPASAPASAQDVLSSEDLLTDIIRQQGCRVAPEFLIQMADVAGFTDRETDRTLESLALAGGIREEAGQIVLSDALCAAKPTVQVRFPRLNTREASDDYVVRLVADNGCRVSQAQYLALLAEDGFVPVDLPPTDDPLYRLHLALWAEFDLLERALPRLLVEGRLRLVDGAFTDIDTLVAGCP